MKSRYGVIIAVLGFIVFFALEAPAADWKSFCTDVNNNEWFYDAQDISHWRDNVIVRTKVVLSDQEKEKYIKEYSQITNIKNINYIVDRWEINCSKNISKHLTSFWYSAEGYDVFSEYYSRSQFHQIVPDSFEVKLAEIVCQEEVFSHDKDPENH